MLDTGRLFTIGQFAKLHEINKKTLMWYDEIGILKPAVIKENGYRYYSYQQSSLLETILMLRELGVSLPDIQHFLQNRSARSLQSLLSEQIEELDRTIAHWKALRASMEKRIQDLEAVCALDVSEISIVKKSAPRYLAIVPTSKDTPVEKEIELVVTEAKKYQLRRLHDASYGAMLPVESIYAGHLEDYSALYIDLPSPVHRKGLHIQPKGTYLRAFSKGAWENLPGRYLQLLDYAKAHHLRFTGFAYEKGINDPVIDTIEEYITQIEIPVEVE